jgi:fucose permease
MTRPLSSETGIALGGLIAMAAAVGIGRFVYTPILPFMEESLGLTKLDASIIASANFLGYLLGALAASMVAAAALAIAAVLVTVPNRKISA